MGLFGLRKRDKVIDLTEHFNTQQITSSSASISSEENTDSVSRGFGILSSLGNNSGNQDHSQENLSSEEKRKRLAKRLLNMTSKMEELSNQIYRLQQRIEVLEKKSGVQDIPDSSSNLGGMAIFD